MTRGLAISFNFSHVLFVAFILVVGASYHYLVSLDPEPFVVFALVFRVACFHAVAVEPNFFVRFWTLENHIAPNNHAIAPHSEHLLS